MLFNKGGLTPKIELVINGEMIETVTSFKFLGIYLDTDLSFKAHYKTLYDKLLKASFVLKSLSRILPKSAMKPLYFAYYHSHLSYGIVNWFPLLKRNQQDKLFTSQKRIVRNIYGLSFRAHCMPVFKAEGILTLLDMIKFENAKLMYRVKNEQCSRALCNFFTLGQGNKHDTRSARTVVHKHNLAIVNKSFLCQAVMDWTKLSMEEKKADNVKKFANNLKKNLLNTY